MIPTPLRSSGNEKEDDDSGADLPPMSTYSYNFRNSVFRSYRYMAASDSGTTFGEPKLPLSLKSPDRDRWIASTEDEFATFFRKGTWTEASEVHRDTRDLPSGFILRIKRDASEKPIQFNSRLAARGY